MPSDQPRKRSRLTRKECLALGLCFLCQAYEVFRAGRCRNCYQRYVALKAAEREAVAREVMEAYGGAVCACCGEKNLVMLPLDHVRQDGAERRREGLDGRGHQFYKQLRQRGFPPGIRVLCWSCNYAVFRSPDGICPHRTGCFATPQSPPTL